jgi:hypothetical protein
MFLVEARVSSVKSDPATNQSYINTQTIDDGKGDKLVIVNYKLLLS